MFSLRKKYIDFLELGPKNFFERVIHLCLFFISLVYRMAVSLRNFFYDHGIFPSKSVQTKILSIGNISWSGSGKTSLAIWLYQKLSVRFSVAILRRGYGRDEELLLKEVTEKVFSAPDRYRVAKQIDSKFDLLLLDDGFQYRRLARTVNIVVVGAREFQRKPHLIPAGIFREPFEAIKRASIVVVNYCGELPNPGLALTKLRSLSPDIKVYFSDYSIKRLSDLNSNLLSLESIRDKRLAAFTAIGYPQGFFAKLENSGLKIVRKIVYPDHHELSEGEYSKIEQELLAAGINDLMITAKDRYHFPPVKKMLNLIIVEIEMQIENENSFLDEIELSLVKK